ncbi:uncharacterized protein LOC144619532 [Crassostrea virginica]
MSKQGEWADHVIVMCMALFLQRDILVITSSPSTHPDNNLLWIHSGRGQSNPLLLGHVWENHYQSLHPCLSLSSEFGTEEVNITNKEGNTECRVTGLVEGGSNLEDEIHLDTEEETNNATNNFIEDEAFMKFVRQ